MLSSGGLGLQKVSSSVLLPSRLSHSPVLFLPATLSFGACSVPRISASFKGSLSCSAPSSASSFACFGSSPCCYSWLLFRSPGLGQHQLQQQRHRRRRPGKSSLVDSILRICSCFKSCSVHYPSSKLSSISFWSSFLGSSVMFMRPGMGQQQRRKSGRARHQMNSILVEAIASTEDPTTNLNQKPLHDELQRYGMDEADYDYTALNLGQQQPNLAQDMKKQKTTSRILRKRKATAESIRGSKQQHPTLKEESGVVEDWCAYLLLSGDLKKTYVGVTYDIRRRLRQHNGEIAGGAKSARVGRPWRLVCTVRGFNSRSEACQFEWKWKSTAAKIKTIAQLDTKIMESPLVTRRRATLAEVLKAKEEWSCLNVQWHAK